MRTGRNVADKTNGAKRGRIFDIQRFSVHDGPGIRTTVFCKGCPLRCLWCHNPEAISPACHLSFSPDRCVVCGACAAVCPEGAHHLAAGEHTLHRERCVVCGQCVEVCGAGALELVGREVTVAEVLAEVIRDRPFYERSGGGLTLSGGEPLAQVEFAAALLEAARAAGLHCCLETCGAVPWSRLERVAPLVQRFLYDLKETDSRRHRELTGAGNQAILDNLRRLHDAGAEIVVRLPVIPGYNARPDHFAAVAALVAELPRLVGVELLPYHRLGLGKRQRLGLPGRELAVAPPDDATVERWRRELRALGVPLLAAD